MRTLGLFLAIALIATSANATGKPPKKTPTTTSANADASAYSASASKSSAQQRQAQRQGQTVTTVSSDRYEAEEIPVNTAASLPGGFCAGPGTSVQTSYVGLSSVDRDYVCARIELFRALIDAEVGVQSVRQALAAERGSKASPGAKISDETLRKLAAEIHGRAVEQLRKADERLGEDDTKVRRFFSRTLGSIPVLSWIAPR